MNQSTHSLVDTLHESLALNKALGLILEKSLGEFDEKKNIEKIFNALGWSNFRDRVASIYVFKKMYGNFPIKTNIDLVEEIKLIESKFQDHGVNSLSRTFLLGFYIKMANIEMENADINSRPLISIPDAVLKALDHSQGRSEKIDWLILTVLHFCHYLGEETLLLNLKAGRKFTEIYSQLSLEAREMMHQNLLAYGASIQESDNFLYEKI